MPDFVDLDAGMGDHDPYDGQIVIREKRDSVNYGLLGGIIPAGWFVRHHGPMRHDPRYPQVIFTGWRWIPSSCVTA